MKALVLGGTGAVGRVIVDELRATGHDAVAASRRSTVAPLDLARPADLARLAPAYDLVINASGVEDARLVTSVGSTPFVDISATAAYLAALAAAAAPGQSVLLGAGLAPGLSTLLVAELPAEPGDDIDLAIVLGTGERHGPAAVEWTAGLSGRSIHEPPEGGAVPNLRERRILPSPTGARPYLRADFPDHLLVGTARDVRVRSYLAVGGRATTAALALVGRFPRLAPALSRAPHVGDARWSLIAVNRRTGIRLAASGDGQSRATGVLTARAAVALHEQRPGRAVSMGEVMTLEEAGFRAEPVRT